MTATPSSQRDQGGSNGTQSTLLVPDEVNGSLGKDLPHRAIPAPHHDEHLAAEKPPCPVLRLANLLVAVLVIVIVHMSERSWAFGQTRFSDQVLLANTLATPARFAWFFWIPVTIYMLVWSVSQTLPTSYDRAANTAHNPVGYMFLVYGFSVIAWQLFWNFGMVPVALVALAGAVFSIVTIYSRIKFQVPQPLPKRFLFTLHIPFGLATAWTVSCLFFIAFSLGLAPKSASLVEPTAALGSILLCLTHLALAVWARDPAPAAVSTFSQVALYIAHSDNAVMFSVTAAMIGMSVSTLVGIILFISGVWNRAIGGRGAAADQEYEHV